MNGRGGEEDVLDSKVAGLRRLGRRLPHVRRRRQRARRHRRPGRGRRSRRDPLPAGPDLRRVAARARRPAPCGRAYDLTALVTESDLPTTCSSFGTASTTRRTCASSSVPESTGPSATCGGDPLGRLVLRHDSFETTPWRAPSPCSARRPVGASAEHGRGVKLDLKEGDASSTTCSPPSTRTASTTNACGSTPRIEALGEDGVRRISRLPILTPSCSARRFPRAARDRRPRAGVGHHQAERLGREPLDRAGQGSTPAALRSLEDFGCEVNLYAVPDLEAFLRPLLLPRSITTDFNFPAWHYFGRAPASTSTTTGTALERPASQPTEGQVTEQPRDALSPAQGSPGTVTAHARMRRSDTAGSGAARRRGWRTRYPKGRSDRIC